MNAPTTIGDVALAAGVSVATVSRALRGLPNVAPDTRQRVIEVAEQLRYRPDPSAAALAAGRTHTAAMVVPLLASWYFSQVMAGAEAVLAASGYDFLLFTADGDEARRRLLAGPLLKRADGLILVDIRVPPEEAADLLDGPLQVVSVGIQVEGAPAIVVDDRDIGREAVHHLASLGHKRIAVIGGTHDDELWFVVPTDRLLGYEDGLRAAGLDVVTDYAVAGDFTVAGGRAAMAQLLDMETPPTAVFAMSDEMAFGALQEMWSRGLEVPGDISLIGVDDHEFSAVVGLTTIHQEVAQHGAIAAELLLDGLDHDRTDVSRHVLSTNLVRRATTGPAPA